MSMNLSCPKCSSDDTQKLSLVMSQGGVQEKGAQLGMSYGLNFMLPAFAVLIAILLGIMFAMANPIVGLIVFGGVLYGGFALRKKLKNKTKSKFADLPDAMKQNGFRCNRCEHLFIPSA
jgi:hypothetical protein